MEKRKQKIKRTADKKWLVSAEQDTWTDKKEDATALSLMEEVKAECFLGKKYKYSEFEVYDAE